MGVNLAILGASTTVGQEILSTLVERDFPVGDINVLATRDAIGREATFGERTLRAKDAEAFDFSTVQASILAIGERQARKWAAKAAAAGSIVIDTSPAFRSDPEAVLLAPEANPEAIAAMLAAALKPIRAEAGLRRVNVVACLPASELGKSAMDELWNQTKGIYVNQSATAREFPRQIAFNVIPQAGDILDNGQTEEEERIVGELRRLLGAGFSISSTCIQAPVFVGASAAVHLELERPLSAIDARSLLRQSPGLMVVDRREDGGYTTPLDAVGEWATFASRIREDGEVPNGLSLWVVSDNIRKAGALNAVQAVEMLLQRGELGARS
jgi:aspartate-semialdehyde dehydrogenase